MNANAPWRWVIDGPDFCLVALKPLACAEPGETILTVRGKNGAYLVFGSGVRAVLKIGAPCPVRKSRNPNRPHYPLEPRRIKSMQSLLESAEALAKAAKLNRPPETTAPVQRSP